MAVTLVSFFVSTYSALVPFEFSALKHRWKYWVVWHIYTTQLQHARFTVMLYTAVSFNQFYPFSPPEFTKITRGDNEW